MMYGTQLLNDIAREARYAARDGFISSDVLERVRQRLDQIDKQFKSIRIEQKKDRRDFEDEEGLVTAPGASDSETMLHRRWRRELTDLLVATGCTPAVADALAQSCENKIKEMR